MSCISDPFTSVFGVSLERVLSLCLGLGIVSYLLALLMTVSNDNTADDNATQPLSPIFYVKSP